MHYQFPGSAVYVSDRLRLGQAWAHLLNDRGTHSWQAVSFILIWQEREVCTDSFILVWQEGDVYTVNLVQTIGATYLRTTPLRMQCVSNMSL